MATRYTDIATSQNDAANNAADKVTDNQSVSGTVRCAKVTYTVPTDGTDVTASDTLNLVQLPQGAIVLPNLCFIEAENPGTALNIAGIGDADDPNRYCEGVDVSAGGTFAFNADNAAAAARTTPYSLTAKSWVQATFTTVTSLTDGQDVIFFIFYTVPS